MHAITFSFAYGSADRAQRIASAIAPELGEIDGGRTEAALSRREETIELRIEATDPIALRAGANTWLGFLEVAETVGSRASPSETA
ncbi:MAG: KEOPS complex subunit Pcc1 [Halodesulfurarchaeum sp.]